MLSYTTLNPSMIWQLLTQSPHILVKRDQDTGDINNIPTPKNRWIQILKMTRHVMWAAWFPEFNSFCCGGTMINPRWRRMKHHAKTSNRCQIEYFLWLGIGPTRWSQVVMTLIATTDLLVVAKWCLKNKMQPTNPNAHTYDNGTDSETLR